MRVIERLIVNVLVENTSDRLSRRPEHITSEGRVLMEAGMTDVTGEALCSAHHGLSLVLTAQAAGETHTILFDGGSDGYAIERNSKRMGIDFGGIEAIVLSHGHYDHSEGLPKALELIRQYNGHQAVPFYVHPGAFALRGTKSPSGQVTPMQRVPSIEEFSALGANVLPSTEAQEIAGGMFYISGEIPRKSFEPGYPGHVRKGTGNVWDDDPLIMDERFLAVHVKDKGLVIFTACSHAGVINILHHAQTIFPDIPLYGVMGGLHLAGRNESLIPQTIAAMKAFDLKMILAGHCTGWRAIFSLLTEFGEQVVDPLAVGTRLTL